jgi:Domain of unknown function (DUF3859)
MRALHSLVLLAAISTTAAAQTVERIDITEVGIYQTTTTEVTAAPGAAVGITMTVDDPKLLEATSTVPARLHTEFGFRYRITGRTGRKVTLKMVTLIPRPGIRDPNTGSTTVRGEYFEDHMVGTQGYRSYGFDNAWEIVTGTWTLEIWEGDRRLTSQSFNVVAEF